MLAKGVLSVLELVELVSPVWGLEVKTKIEKLWSSAHFVHTTAKQVISLRRKDENGYETYKNEKCTRKAKQDDYH